MFGPLKPTINPKKSFKNERVDTCLLAHTFPLAFLLTPPPSSLFADTCSHAHILISLPFPLSPPCPFTLPLFILSIHIASLRGEGGQPWGGLGLPSSPSHLYPQGGSRPLPSSPTSTHSSTHPPRTPPPSPLLHHHTTSTPSAPITEFRSLCCKCVCGQFHCWLGAQWFGCFVRQNHFLKSQKKSTEIAAGHHTSIVFALGEAERFMFGLLKPRIDAKKKTLKVKELTLACSRILFHWLFSSLPPPPFPLTLARTRIFSSTCPPPFTPCSFALPLFILSIHIAPLRGGGGQPWGGLGLPSSPSHLYPQGVRIPLPSSPTSTHSSTHPPRTPPPSPLLHAHTTSTPSAPITEFRSLCCKCVCGQFHCWLGAQWFGCFVRQNHFFKSQKKSKRIAAGHHTSIVFALGEAKWFMFGRLKPRIDAKKKLYK